MLIEVCISKLITSAGTHKTDHHKCTQHRYTWNRCIFRHTYARLSTEQRHVVACQRNSKRIIQFL